ncbi:MAG: SprT family zinc-dependent metalloprotease [Chloroflexota bacterium]
MTELKFDSINVPVDVHPRRVRHIYLRILPGPRLELVIPRHCLTSVDEVLSQKQRWIRKKATEMAGARKLVSDSSFILHGKSYVIETATGGNGVILNGDIATIFLRPRSRADAVLRRFLTAETLSYASEQVRHLCKKLGVSCHAISTREMRKWGYCTRNGKLCFNWRLICLPPELAEYIVIHETLHLKHFNHSKRFKTVLARLLPAYRDREISLRGYLAN